MIGLGSILGAGNDGSDSALIRMVIRSYESVDCTGDVKSEFTVQTNPEKIKYAYGVREAKSEGGADAKLDIGTSTATGAPSPPSAFEGYMDQEMTFDFYADATGLIPVGKAVGIEMGPGKTPSIREHLELLQDTVYSFQSETHGAPYLALEWGKVFPNSNPSEAKGSIYKCTLVKCEIEVLLFSLAGEPVRAKISLSVKSLIAAKARPPMNSPDITHNIDIRYGDKMTTICKKIYGRYDSKICAAIATYNNLVDWDLSRVEGKQLVFPSIHLLNQDYLEEWDKLEKEQKVEKAQHVVTHYEHMQALIGDKKATQYFKTFGFDPDQSYEEWSKMREKTKTGFA